MKSSIVISKCAFVALLILFLSGCDHYDLTGRIDCSTGTCIIDIDHWYVTPFNCDTNEGGRGISEEEKQAFCGYGSNIVDDYCGTNGSANFQFNQDDVRENGPQGPGTTNQNFDFQCTSDGEESDG